MSKHLKGYHESFVFCYLAKLFTSLVQKLTVTFILPCTVQFISEP